MSPSPAPRFEHLSGMSTDVGTFEHAELAQPRPEHGYCTDDMARVLVVTTREERPTAELRRLTALSLRFLGCAEGPGGYRNRMDLRGRWTDREYVGDAWGRSVWGLGTAAARSQVGRVRQASLRQFSRSAQLRSPWLRATAFAAVGAAEVLSVDPGDQPARALLTDAAKQMPRPAADPRWPWPEPRLAYANAVIPEAMIVAGQYLEHAGLLQQGLELLSWLLEHETLDGHLSLTPVGGARTGDPKPAYDQQPIEAAALADACVRAATVDHDTTWTDGVAKAVGWFLGDNDSRQVMWDPSTGGGFDGLHADGRNANQGAESTLAVAATLQHGQRLVLAGG
jgi:hypothetical protein